MTDFTLNDLDCMLHNDRIRAAIEKYTKGYRLEDMDGVRKAIIASGYDIDRLPMQVCNALVLRYADRTEAEA